MQYMDKLTGEVLTKVSAWEIIPAMGPMARFQASSGALLSHCKSDVEPVRRKRGKSMEEWSNNACLGYAIKAAQQLGYSDEQISRLVRTMYSVFDFTSVAEAKEIYNKSPY